MHSNVKASSVQNLLAFSCSCKRATDDHATPFTRAGNINTCISLRHLEDDAVRSKRQLTYKFRFSGRLRVQLYGF